MATKEHRRHARGLIESLESRVHAGPRIDDSEILSAQEFLRENDFSPTSEYFSRLGQVRTRLQARSAEPPVRRGKRNYGGKVAGLWVQVQSIYDHVIISTCYHGEFNLKRGRIKLSHRFNEAGRIDFVEAKLLHSFHPQLHGEIRKPLVIKDYLARRKDWFVADAFVLPVLPQELLLVDENFFRCSKPELYAGLINLGHSLVRDLLDDAQVEDVPLRDSESQGMAGQLCLGALHVDPVALPILESAAALDVSVEPQHFNSAQVSCVRRFAVSLAARSKVCS